MVKQDLDRNLWSVLSDSLKSPIAVLATSSLTISLILGAIFFTNNTGFAWPLIIALIISLVSTFVAIIRAKRITMPGQTIHHHEPEFIKGSKKIQQNPGLGYRLEEHYNTELDPTISYVKTFVEPEVISSWHRLQDKINPIEARFYILSGDGSFELLDPITRTKYMFDLVRGDSLLVPDSYWRRFKNNSKSDVLEIMVICVPRWHSGAFASFEGEIYELPT